MKIMIFLPNFKITFSYGRLSDITDDLEEETFHALDVVVVYKCENIKVVIGNPHLESNIIQIQ